MSYCTDKLMIDGQTHAHTHAGNDNTEGQNWPRVKTAKLRVTGLCAGNSPGTGDLPEQMASYAENVSIWWRNHV